MAEKFRPNNVEARGHRRPPEAARAKLDNLEKNDSMVLQCMNSVGTPVSALQLLKMQLLKNADDIRKVDFCFSDETREEIRELASSPELDRRRSDLAEKAFAIRASLERLLINDRIVIQDVSGTCLYALTHADDQKTEESNARGLYTSRT